MFTKEETNLIIEIITGLEFDDEEKKNFQKKLVLLKEMIEISEETQSKMSKIQEEINSLTKKEGE